MDERLEVNAFDQITITRMEDGKWKVEMREKNGGIIGRLADQAATIDEAAALIKKRYRVD
ncbi:hypothetical protein [Pseudochrobactrum sp. HB0163]|uniref:hypothetical protein n=1 Tax=Pseudochrobactrum sp. HB0163 TaxID=3450708 RepID=UPI003F6DABF8